MLRCGTRDGGLKVVLPEDIADALARREDADASAVDHLGTAGADADDCAVSEEEGTAGTAVLGSLFGQQELPRAASPFDVDPGNVDDPGSPTREVRAPVDADRDNDCARPSLALPEVDPRDKRQGSEAADPEHREVRRPVPRDDLRSDLLRPPFGRPPALEPEVLTMELDEGLLVRLDHMRSGQHERLARDRRDDCPAPLALSSEHDHRWPERQVPRQRLRRLVSACNGTEADPAGCRQQKQD